MKMRAKMMLEKKDFAVNGDKLVLENESVDELSTQLANLARAEMLTKCRRFEDGSEMTSKDIVDFLTGLVTAAPSANGSVDWESTFPMVEEALDKLIGRGVLASSGVWEFRNDRFTIYKIDRPKL